MGLGITRRLYRATEAADSKTKWPAVSRPVAAVVVTIVGLFLFSTCAVGESADDRSAAGGRDIRLVDQRPAVFAGAFTAREPIAGSPVQYFRESAGEPEPEFVLAGDGSPLEIVEFGPSGELPVEVRRPTVFVVFNQPMVPLARLGAPMDRSPLMRIDPELPGLYRWHGSRILSFQPNEPMTAQLEYDVTIGADAASLLGMELAEPHRFSFYREPLDIVALYPGTPASDPPVDSDNAPPALAREATLEFSYPVSIDYIERYLEVRILIDDDGHDVRAPAAHTLPFTLRLPGGLDDEPNRRDRTVVLELAEEPPANRRVEVTLAAGARSRPEYRGREKPVAKSFHTLRPFAYRQHRTFSYYRAGSLEQDATTVLLDFSHPPAAQEWNDVLRVSLPVDDMGDHITRFGNTIRLDNLPVEYESTYEIEIMSHLRDVHGRRLAPTEDSEEFAAATVAIDVPAAGSYFHTPNRGARMYEAEFPPRVIFELQNPLPGVWRAGATDDQFAGFRPDTLEPYDLDHIERNRKHFEQVDLGEYLNEDGYGSVGVSWNFAPRRDDGGVDPRRQIDLQLQVTDLGVTTRYAHNRLLVLVRSLESGEPVGGAHVTLSNYERPGGPRWDARTDEDGLAAIDLPAESYARELSLGEWRDRLQLEVSHGSDRVLFRPGDDHNTYRHGVGNRVGPVRAGTPEPVPYLVTDRGLYRPGEEVAVRLIDRTLTAGEYEPYEGAYTITAGEDRWRAEPFGRIEERTSASGGGYATIRLPEDLDPGWYVIEYSRPEMEWPHRVGFQVAHFRRAAFAVDVTTPPEPVFRGDRLRFAVAAEFLAGGAVSGGTHSYTWTRHPSAYRPPGDDWEEFRFGPRVVEHSRVIDRGEGVLDSAGRSSRSIETGTEGVAGMIYRFELEARVRDASRQEIASRASTLVHPAEFYLGTKLASGDDGWMSFTEAGQTTEAQIVAVRPDGGSYDGIAELRVEWIERRREAIQQRGVGGRIHTRYETVDEIVSQETLEMRGGNIITSFTPENAGRYLLRVSAEDREGRTALTELGFLAIGAQWVGRLSAAPDEISIRAVRERYEVGDTAELVVETPIPDGRYLLSIERDGILDHRFVDIEGSAGTVEVEIADEHVPVVYVALSSASGRTADPPQSYFDPDLGKPTGFFGIAAIAVDPAPRRLDIEIEPDREVYRPGAEAQVRVRVTLEGLPVEGAEVSLFGVDRGVLDLIDYRIPDPIERFYSPARFPLGVRGADSRNLLVDPVVYEADSLHGGGGKGAEAPGEAAALDDRADFRPLAVFEPELITDADGYAGVSFEWPDSLTVYRLTAIAAERSHFGRQEREVSVENRVTVREALPQSMRVRDTAFAGLVLTNRTEVAQRIEVSLEIDDESAGAASPLTPERARQPAPALDSVDDRTGGPHLPDGEPHRFELGAGETIEQRFLLSFATPGTARFAFTVRSDVVNERLHAELPVRADSAREAFTIAGSLDGGASAEEALVLPRSVLPGSGALELRFTGVRFDHLREPFRRWMDIDDDRSLEMLVYRAAPFALLGDRVGYVLAEKAETARRHAEWLFDRLGAFQHRDGGFVFRPQHTHASFASPARQTLLGGQAVLWMHETGYRPSDPGDPVSGEDTGRSGDPAQDKDSGRSGDPAPADAPLHGGPSPIGDTAAARSVDEAALAGRLSALAVDERAAPFERAWGVLLLSALAPRHDIAAEVNAVAQLGDELGAGGYALLSVAAERTGQRQTANSAFDRLRSLLQVGTRSVDFVETYDARSYFDSTVVRSATALLAYRAREPESIVPDRLLATITRATTGSPWTGSFDTMWAAIAAASMDEAVDDDPIEIRTLLAARELFSAEVTALHEEPSAHRLALDAFPLSEIERGSPHPLRFENRGERSHFYSATLSYDLPSEIVRARDEGFSIYREIEDLEGNPISPEELVAGNTYRISATIGSDRNRFGAFLRVPVASGMEVLDGSLATTGSYAEAGGVTGREWTRETDYGDTESYIGEGFATWSPGRWHFYSIEPEQRIYPGSVTYYFPQLYPGTQRVSFLARAVNPGVYPVPPASIALEGEEEVFGRSDGELAIIE